MWLAHRSMSSGCLPSPYEVGKRLKQRCPLHTELRRRAGVALRDERAVDQPDSRLGRPHPLLGDLLVGNVVPTVERVPIEVCVVLAAILLVLAALVLDHEPVLLE